MLDRTISGNMTSKTYKAQKQKPLVSVAVNTPMSLKKVSGFHGGKKNGLLNGFSESGNFLEIFFSYTIYGSVSGTKITVITNNIAATTTRKTKVPLHPNPVAIAPPMTGPTIGPTRGGIPNIPIAYYNNKN